jgi:DNA-binding MarR family transcriptional regulator
MGFPEGLSRGGNPARRGRGEGRPGRPEVRDAPGLAVTDLRSPQWHEVSPTVPLSVQLSQLLVAFTIEFDNESEHRIGHWTTNGGRGSAPRGTPWLISQAPWVNVLQYVDDVGEDGIRVGELHARSRTDGDLLAGLQRWGYVVTEPNVKEVGSGAARDDVVVRLRKAGRQGAEVWRPLAAEIEQRWRSRFGSEMVDALRGSLSGLRDQFDLHLPLYLPIVSPTQNKKAAIATAPALAPPRATDELDLSALLAQVLLQFTLDYEAVAAVSLPIAANTLRVLNDEGVPGRDLPRLTGVSKEGNAMALGFLARRDCVVTESDETPSRGKRIRLTPKGKRSQDKYHRLLAETEVLWEDRYGRAQVEELRRSLDRTVGDAPLRESLLFEGMRPHPDGWRASARPPETLPHYPMVLHRGGYPDGS